MAFQEILMVIILQFWELLKLPFIDNEIAWTVVPLLVAMLVMFIYFRRYSKEELGWNSAVANCVVILFVSIELLKHIYFKADPVVVANFTNFFARTLFAIVFLIAGIILLILNMHHSLPRSVAYHLSSPLTLNILGYVLIVFTHSSIKYSAYSLIAIILLFVVLRLAIHFLEIPVEKLFFQLDEMKRQEKVQDIKRAKEFVKKTKKELEINLKKKRKK